MYKLHICLIFSRIMFSDTPHSRGFVYLEYSLIVKKIKYIWRLLQKWTYFDTSKVSFSLIDLRISDSLLLSFIKQISSCWHFTLLSSSQIHKSVKQNNTLWYGAWVNDKCKAMVFHLLACKNNTWKTRVCVCVWNDNKKLLKQPNVYMFININTLIH